MNQQDLDKILEQHKLWLQDPTKGKRANLSCANLSCANLDYANLRSADLCGANLSYANLRSADLRGADLSYANLSSADLRGADLSDADLHSANLSDAELRSADLSNTMGLSAYQICNTGTLIGWKKTWEGNILKLQIPASAKRCNKLGSRKCRANKAKVLGLYSADGKRLKFNSIQHSVHYTEFTYTKGQLIEVPNFCDDIHKECAPGIHFFVTFEEAAGY